MVLTACGSGSMNSTQALVRWIQPAGLPFAIVDDVDALPKDIRTSVDIVERFGRFPHRNAILGRAPRADELAAGKVVSW